MSAQLPLPHVPHVDDDRDSDLDVADVSEVRARARALESALACIERECDAALRSPEIAMTSICRIDAVARQTLRPGPPADEGN